MTNTKAGKRAYWAKHVKRWRKSGETKSSYSRRHNLKPYQLTYWVQVFESKPQAENKPSPKGFVPVQIVEPSIQGLTVKLPNGLKLEGIDSDNLDVTRALIGSLV